MRLEIKIYLQILEFRYRNCQTISDVYQAIFQTKYKETYKNEYSHFLPDIVSYHSLQILLIRNKVSE